MNYTKYHKAFRKFGIATIIITYLVILAGGIVRTTGSGMGCPDWPKCFGNWIPPTDASQLPDNYQEIFLDKRLKKSERLAAMLHKIGFEQLASQILNDPAVKVEAPFNLTQTWIEYINRLLGVLTGFFVLLVAGTSLAFWNTDRTITYCSIASLILIMFQGWIGSLVVATNLMPWMVSVHMLLALALVALLIYAIARSFRGDYTATAVPHTRTLNWVLIAGMLLFLIQIVLGTQVREEVDIISMAFDHLQREKWIEDLGMVFYIHRSYSLLLLLLHLYLWYLLKQNIPSNSKLGNWTGVLLASIVLEIVTGAMMAYLAIPKALQPVHLLLATMIFGMQFWIWLQLNFERFFPKNMAEE